MLGLGLTQEAVDGVLAAGEGFTTAFNYNLAGQVSATRNFSGEVIHTTTDTDGREARSQLLAAGATTAHSFVLWERDAFMRPTRTRRFAGDGASLGVVERTFDNEDRLLSECAEAVTGGCAPHAPPGACSTRSRSPIPRQADRAFHGKLITRSTRS